MIQHQSQVKTPIYTYLLPIHNKKPPFPSHSNVPRAEPALAKSPLRRLLIVEIPIGNQRTPNNQLPLLPLSHIPEILINHPQLDPWQDTPNTPTNIRLTPWHSSNRARRLAQPPSLTHTNTLSAITTQPPRSSSLQHPIHRRRPRRRALHIPELIGNLLTLRDPQPDARDGVKRRDLVLAQVLEQVVPAVALHPDDRPARVDWRDEVAEEAGDVGDGQVGEGAVFGGFVGSCIHT